MVCFGECCVDCLLGLILMFPIQAGVSCMWTNDSKRLLLEHFDTIHNSPSQLYHSALPFCPSSSWLHEYYSPELLQEAKVIKGLPKEWEMYSRTIPLDHTLWSLSYQNNTIAVGSNSGKIFILDAITGSQKAILSGHAYKVDSVTFSSDGTSLVSGSYDKTVKLWDMQTGGIVRRFYGHTEKVNSVSISADHTRIASGSKDRTLRLWDIQKGECQQIIEHQRERVYCVMFSPKNPQCLISASSGGTIQQWDTNGNKVGPTYDGYYTTFLPDGVQFISHTQDDVTIHNINSGLVVTKLHIGNTSRYTALCFSPDHKLMAINARSNICIWDITGSDPHLVKTLFGHTNGITSLVFSSPSTLISASYDNSVKLWQIGTSSTGPIVTNPKHTPLTLPPTKSTALKVKNRLIIPNNLPDRVVQTWGIMTGLHKGPLQIQAQDSHQSNTQLIGNKLIFVWYADDKINIWDAEKGELLQTINVPRGSVKDLIVLGDGSKVFCMYKDFIQAWDIWTGEAVGKVRAQDADMSTRIGMVAGEEIISHRVEGSKIWIWVLVPQWGFVCMEWDFGIPGSPPILFPSKKNLPGRLHLSDNKVWEIGMSRMEDVVTGKIVVQLPRRFGKATRVRWGGRYLVVSFKSGEAVILDFSNVPL